MLSGIKNGETSGLQSGGRQGLQPGLHSGLREGLINGISAKKSFKNNSEQIGTGFNMNVFEPVYGLYGNSWAAQIYTAAEVGWKKTLHGISFYWTGWTTPATFINQRIWVCHVKESQFTATPQCNLSDLTTSDLLCVKNYFSLTINNNNMWMDINFDNTFNFNGSDNLLIMWYNENGSWYSGYGGAGYTMSTNNAAYKGDDNGLPTGTANR